MALRMVVMRRVRGGAFRVIGWTQFQQKWRAAARHESDGDIRAKQQYGQQHDGQPAGSSSITVSFLHVSQPRCQESLLFASSTIP